MKKLLVVSEKYWPFGGGAELATHLILDKIKDFFNITVVTGCNEPKLLQGVKFSYLPFLNAQTKIQLWINLLIKQDYIRDLVEQFDVVYIPRLAYPIVSVAKKCRKKVVVHLHDYQPLSFEADVNYPFEDTYQHGLLRDMKKSFTTELLKANGIQRAFLSTFLTPVNQLTRFWVSMADEVICVSKRQSEILKRALPEISVKLEVIYNPLPRIPYIQKKLDDFIFLYVGGSSYLKGIEVLTKASIRLLRRRRAKFLLTKISEKKFQTLFAKLNRRFGNAFLVLDKMNHDNILNMHITASSLILPSILEEPLPYTLLESMLAGTIPIASRVGGVPEIVKGTIAEKLLFTPRSIEELVERMEWVLSLSSEELLKYGIQLREETLSRFNSARVLKSKLLIIFNG